MRTQKEVETEIAALEACKKYIPAKTLFGDDNVAGVDLQIQTLRDEIDTTSDEFNDFSDDEQSAVFAAKDWADGHTDESPSSGWDSYKPKEKVRRKKKKIRY